MINLALNCIMPSLNVHVLSLHGDLKSLGKAGVYLA